MLLIGQTTALPSFGSAVVGTLAQPPISGSPIWNT